MERGNFISSLACWITKASDYAAYKSLFHRVLVAEPSEIKAPWDLLSGEGHFLLPSLPPYCVLAGNRCQESSLVPSRKLTVFPSLWALTSAPQGFTLISIIRWGGGRDTSCQFVLGTFGHLSSSMEKAWAEPKHTAFLTWDYLVGSGRAGGFGCWGQ